MNRNYNEYRICGSSALKVNRREEESRGPRVVCIPGARRFSAVVSDCDMQQTVGYCEHARNSLNYIYDSIESGTARGQSLSFFTSSQVVFMSIASVLISLAAIVL